MRKDAIGFFWQDLPPEPKQKKTQQKRTPPEPTWLREDYLPGLQEALSMPGLYPMTDADLLQAQLNREPLLFDIECYRNYFLASFRSAVTGKYIYFESYPGKELDIAMLELVLTTFTTIGFNSIGYDLPITYLALAGKPLALLKAATDLIIKEGWSASDVLKQYKVKRSKGYDHIDLIEVAPLRAGLKIYGGRLHTPRMQDLPFDPDIDLNENQRAIVRWYNLNADLTSTGFLHHCLKEHLELRATMSNEIKVDMRSRSDAQIAEHVISHEYERRMRKRPQKPIIDVGTVYRYKTPSWMQFTSPLMNYALNVVQNAEFVVGENGAIGMPEVIKDLKLDINGSVYTMGIGGLHSTESTVAHVTDKDYVLIDRDVTSYYPFIILNLGLYPEHLGPAFLQIYRDIVYRRIAAKKAGNKVVADSLKITINGAYGKLGSKYSVLYAPDLLIQVTLTGQLSLLMMIETLELAGIHVVSANTDGIVIKCPRNRISDMEAIVKWWERVTGFETEESRYMALYSRDVNNYIAMKQKFDKSTKQWVEELDGFKSKGAYADPWSGSNNLADRLHKNPANLICIEAVRNWLRDRTPLLTTIAQCQDITKFISVRTVKGGAVKMWNDIPPPVHNTKEELLELAGFVQEVEGYWKLPDESSLSALTLEQAYKEAVRMLTKSSTNEYLGKSIRWYYARDIGGELVYALSGNRVPRSEGAKPCMDLPDKFPDDVDYDWYLHEAEKILNEIGVQYS